MSNTMQAIVQNRYGPPDVLELKEIAKPQIGDDEVLVRVKAAGVDRGVWHLMTGLPYFLRLIIPDLGRRAPKNPVRGSDVAGVVEAMGKEVTRFKLGDEVFGIGMGSYAGYTRALESKLALKPANLTFEQAAVVPISGLSALQAVRDSGKVRSGQKVLVIGASGGVGTFAVQIAKALGAEVTGVASTTKLDLIRSLGAHQVVDYTHEDFAEKKHYYDVILDTGGHSSLSHLRRALAPQGTAVIVGAETDGKWFGGFDRSIRAMVLSRFIDQTLVAFVNSENADDLIAITELIEAGKVTPTVDRAFPLSEAPKAISYLIDGHARGKVVVTIDDTNEGGTG
jgi:NADPH:quinone reductase-like Zn-dependent oxidoreductase